MTKIHPEPVEIMTPIAEVPRVEAEASRNEEATRTARVLQRPISREVLENLAYSVPKFDGKLEDWLIFKHHYVNRVHIVPEFTDTEKLLFLRGCVVGELGEQVARIGVSGANYSCAWAMVQGKFENKERELKAKHMSLLLELPEMVEESAEGLYCLIENTRRHLQALRMLGVKIPHDFLVVSLAKKLDPLTQFEWKIAAKDWEPTIEEMLEYLMRKVNFLVEIARIVEMKRQRGEEAAKCAFCNCPDHYLHQCFRFTEWPVEERIKWVENMGLCKKCFRDHYSSQCKFRACYKCNGEHNILLHEDEPLNPCPQVVIARRLANMHLNAVTDEGTSDEGISESEESVSSQEEKYMFRQENEVQIETYIDHEGVFRGYDLLSPESIRSEEQNGEIEIGSYQDLKLLQPAVEEQKGEIHSDVLQGEENELHVTTTIPDESNREPHKDTYQEDRIVLSPEVADPKNQNGEYHENTCHVNNNIPPEVSNQNNQYIEPQEDPYENDQNVVPLEADQGEQNIGLHLGACHEDQDVLPDEIEDEDEQEINIICHNNGNCSAYQDPTYESPTDPYQDPTFEAPADAYQDPTFEAAADNYQQPEFQSQLNGYQNQNFQPEEDGYQEQPYEPPVEVCQTNGQNIMVPAVVYQQAQYGPPPEVTYPVEGQNVMPHAMVYPPVPYMLPQEEAYPVVEPSIPPPKVVYPQYVCAYPVDGQLMMPPGMTTYGYQPEQYVAPQPQEAYPPEDQNLVLPSVVYQPLQYIDPQVVDQSQAISPEPLMYSVPYYAAAQPIQPIPPQQNILLPEPNVVHQQPHAIQQPHVIQQQHAIQHQHQQVIQQQHIIQQQQRAIHHQHHVIHQQHVVQQQQAIHQHRVMQQHQQQQAIQQQHIIRQAPRPCVAHGVPPPPPPNPARPEPSRAAPQTERPARPEPEQGASAAQPGQTDASQAECDAQLAGRLRPDAVPFLPNGREVMLSDGQVYVMSRLNYNAQEFVPQGGVQPLVEEDEGEVKSKIKQYLSRVVAMLV